MEVRIQSDGGRSRVWIDGVEVTKKLRVVEFAHDDLNKRPTCRIVMNRMRADGSELTENGNVLTEVFEPWMTDKQDKQEPANERVNTNGPTRTGTEAERTKKA